MDALTRQMVNDALSLGGMVNGDPSMRAAVVLARLMPGFLAPAMRGRWYTTPTEQNVVLVPANPLSLAATIGDTDDALVVVPTHMDFFWKSTLILSGTDGGTAPTFTAQFTSGSHDRNMIQGRSSGVHALAFRSRSDDWAPLPKAELVTRNSSVRVKLTNLAATAHARVEVAMQGVAQYDLALLDNTISR